MAEKNPVTLLTAQWGDLPFEQVCQKASAMGYEGLEIGGGDHMDLIKAAGDPAYVEQKKELLAKYNLKCFALATHPPGKMVGDTYDIRHDNLVPDGVKGKPEEMRAWAVDQMMHAPAAMKNMGATVTTSFLGSPIWNFWYSFPQTTEEMVEAGYARIKELWTPIFDEFDKQGVRFALEVHATEIAYDIYTSKKLLEVLDSRETFGFNFDPSHLLWQGIKPHIFIRNFPDKIYHVHMKDVYVSSEDSASIIGSHLLFGDPRRRWNFRSITAMIDLSVGATAALVSGIGVMVLNATGSITLMLLFCLAFGLVLGLVNGLLVTKGGLPPFIATLATQSAYRSIIVQIGQGGPFNVDSALIDRFRLIASGSLFGLIPYMVIIFILVAVMMSLLLKKTKFGNYVFIIGSNENASTLVAIGGTSMSGGRGRIIGTFLGAVMLQMIQGILIAANIPPFLTGLVKGIIIIVAVILQRDQKKE